MTEGKANGATGGGERKLTIIDVARHSQVSKSTVSRVLNGSPHVASETRERVLEAVSDLDFSASSAARGLRTTRSFLVGYLVPAINNDIFSRVAEVLEEDLRDEGVGLVIVSSGWDAAGERHGLQSLRDHRVDTLVLSLVNDRDSELASVLSAIGRPVVLIDREIPGVKADVVLTDLRIGVRKALEHLAELGHHRVGIAHLSLDVRPGRQVSSAFEATVAALGLNAVAHIAVPYNRIDRHYGAEIAERMLAEGATAIVCALPNNVTAGVLEYLDGRGVSIPEDISIVAMDESELASVKRPQLTVMSRQIDSLAHHASRMVTSRLANPDLEPRVKVIPTSLEPRGSTAPPPINVPGVA
jgi:LacI family transcriptional regulator